MMGEGVCDVGREQVVFTRCSALRGGLPKRIRCGANTLQTPLLGTRQAASGANIAQSPSNQKFNRPSAS